MVLPGGWYGWYIYRDIAISSYFEKEKEKPADDASTN